MNGQLQTFKGKLADLDSKVDRKYEKVIKEFDTKTESFKTEIETLIDYKFEQYKNENAVKKQSPTLWSDIVSNFEGSEFENVIDKQLDKKIGKVSEVQNLVLETE